MSSVVRARIDDKLKDDAEAVLEAQGLSVSDAIRLMMVRIAAEGKLPFDPYTPIFSAMGPDVQITATVVEPTAY